MIYHLFLNRVFPKKRVYSNPTRAHCLKGNYAHLLMDVKVVC
jgi:hypothetical protein